MTAVAAPAAVRFWVSGNPQTKGSLTVFHRWGPMIAGKATCKTGLAEHNAPKLRQWRALVATAAANAMRQLPPFSGPVAVTLTFYFARPDSHSKAQRLIPWAAVNGRHDADKVARLCLDAFKDAAVYVDDGLVSRLVVEKVYCDEGERPGVAVTLEGLL